MTFNRFANILIKPEIPPQKKVAKYISQNDYNLRMNDFTVITLS